MPSGNPRRDMAVGAALGAFLGGALFLVVDPKPAGCDGLLMGAIHCIVVPFFGLLLAAGGGALAGAVLAAGVALVRR